MHRYTDGTLYDWPDIEDMGWSTLLLGNGFSVNVSRDFAYQSLFEEAIDPKFKDGLSSADKTVFEAFRTTNFEGVLAKLRDAVVLAEVLDQDPDPYRERFRTVQSSLGATVRRVHLERTEIPDETLQRIREVLVEYKQIFSTSYDLLLYWSMAHGDNFHPFCDCFWSGGRNRFDPENCNVFPGVTPIYYLHGALHLVVEGTGQTRKLTQSHQTLLDQFGKPIPGDPDSRPLIISEATARDKLAAIERNDYLAHAYEKLESCDGPIVVFGNSLSDQDRHLIDAINSNADRPVAISMRPKSAALLKEEQAKVWGPLKSKEIYFFDSATHPLGKPELSLKGKRRRAFGKFFRIGVADGAE